MGVMYPQVSNPCEEERYIELKKKSLDNMSDREYEYFKQKDKECSEYNLKQTDLRKKSKNNDFNFNSSLGGILVNNAWAINGYQRLEDSWGYGLIISYYEDTEGSTSRNHNLVPYISYEFPTNSNFISPSLFVGVNYSYVKWTYTYYSLSLNTYHYPSGTITDLSPTFGFGLNLKISKRFSFGLMGGMAQYYTYSMYEDGSSKIIDREYRFLPAVTLNLLDLFNN